jgi:hypothetical protein
MTTLGTTVPYYGGGQVPNPANVIYPGANPPSSNLKVRLGTIAVVSGTAYIATALTGGVTTWSPSAGGSSDVSTLSDTANTSVAPAGGNIKLSGTTNQVTITAGTNKLTWTIPAVFIAPGSIASTTTNNAGTTMTAGTGITATTGNITASSGNVSASGTVTGGTGVIATTGAVTASAGQVIAGGDTGGVASTIAVTNTSSSTISTGVGSVKMSSANPATNTEWLKIYIGTSAFWIPAWTTNAP